MPDVECPQLDTVSLKEYMDMRFKNLEENMNLHFNLLQVAVDKAEATNLSWRAAANEWRAAMQDKDANFVTKSTLDEKLTVRDSKIDSLQKNVNIVLGAAMMLQVLIGVAMAVILKVWTGK